MPLYEYRCKQCGAENEFLSNIGDTGKGLACKSCGSKKLEKMLSVTNIPVHTSPCDGKTCGMDEKCDGPQCGAGCCYSG